jgi:metacaspase-1
MAAHSLHLGLNKIDPKHYGTNGALSGCINDAKSMEAIARSRGFETTLLLDDEATAEGVLDWLAHTARIANAGDTIFVSYAGHGSQVTDTHVPGEPDGRDETWCLYNRMLVDDELGQAWSRFPAAVRIVLVSDSCHSATVARALALLSTNGALGMRELVDVPFIGRSFSASDSILRYRVLPDTFPTQAETSHRELYASIQRSTVGQEDVEIAATVLSLTACQDDEVAGDGTRHGVFTQAFLDVWGSGAFTGSYRTLFDAIKARMGAARQRPNYRIDGTPNASLEAESPFRPTTDSRKTAEEDHMTGSTSIDERLSTLMGDGDRIIGGDGNGPDFCRMVLTVPRQAIVDRPDQEVFEFLQQNAAPTLMKAFLTATNVKLASREFEGRVECHADTSGKGGCSGSVSIRF